MWNLLSECIPIEGTIYELGYVIIPKYYINIIHAQMPHNHLQCLRDKLWPNIEKLNGYGSTCLTRDLVLKTERHKVYMCSWKTLTTMDHWLCAEEWSSIYSGQWMLVDQWPCNGWCCYHPVVHSDTSCINLTIMSIFMYVVALTALYYTLLCDNLLVSYRVKNKIPVLSNICV